MSTQPASQQTALFWRDAARQRFATGDAEGALARDRKGLVAAGLALREDLDGGALTALARSRDGEEWLASGLRGIWTVTIGSSRPLSPSTATTGDPAAPAASPICGP